MRIPCPLRSAARRSPDAPAIVGARGILTFGELDQRVSVAAVRVRELGFGAGDRVALHLPKDEQYLVLLLALIRAGCVACLLSSRLPPQGAAPLPERTACRALISASEELLDAAGVRTLRPEVLLTDEASRRPQPSDELWLARDQASTIVFTSGSAGPPKAALHTFGNHYYSAKGSNANISLEPGGRWLQSLPLYHVGGLSILFRCLLAGATVVLPETGVSLSRAMTEGGATHVSLVSTQLLRLLREEGFEGHGLEAILLGGGPMPASLVDEAADRGLPVHTSYGLTEMASQVSTTPPGATRKELHTSGRPLPHREVEVSGEGEILVRGETLFAGYVAGGALDRPLDAAGWFHTGDLGYLDEKGYLRVRGRKDNLFVSGGENVQPEEIEESLSGLEDVEEAVVVPVPDAEFGARPVAFVRTASGVVEGETLALALEKVLPRFKIPVYFHGWPEKTGPGEMKVDRASFREHAGRLQRTGLI